MAATKRPTRITKAEFQRFDDVMYGCSRVFDPITGAKYIASAAKLSLDKYWSICRNYGKLRKRFIGQ